MLAVIPQLSLAKSRLKLPCPSTPSTLSPQSFLPIDHTEVLLLAVFIFLVTDRQTAAQTAGGMVRMTRAIGTGWKGNFIKVNK